MGLSAGLESSGGGKEGGDARRAQRTLCPVPVSGQDGVDLMSTAILELLECWLASACFWGEKVRVRVGVGVGIGQGDGIGSGGWGRAGKLGVGKAGR